MNRCKCGKVVILPYNNTGSTVSKDSIVLGPGLKWENHSVSKCDGYVSIEVGS